MLAILAFLAANAAATAVTPPTTPPPASTAADNQAALEILHAVEVANERKKQKEEREAHNQGPKVTNGIVVHESADSSDARSVASSVSEWMKQQSGSSAEQAPVRTAVDSSCSDTESWADSFGYNCAGWANQCAMGHALTECAAGAAPGPDGIGCEVGGWGPDAYGYYYSAAFMADVRAHCPASCDACNKNSCTDHEYTVYSSEDGRCRDAPDELVTATFSVGCSELVCDGSQFGRTDDPSIMAIIKGYCPLSCGGCDEFCTNKEAMMAGNAKHFGTPATCADFLSTFSPSPECQPLYQVGCAADAGFCHGSHPTQQVPQAAFRQGTMSQPSPSPGAQETKTVVTVTWGFSVTVDDDTNLAQLDAEVFDSTLETLNSALGGVSISKDELTVTRVMGSATSRRRLQSGKSSGGTTVSYDATVTLDEDETGLSSNQLENAAETIESFVSDASTSGFSDALAAASDVITSSAVTTAPTVETDEVATGGSLSGTGSALTASEEDDLGAILGGVFGGLAAIALVGIICYCMSKNKGGGGGDMPPADLKTSGV